MLLIKLSNASLFVADVTVQMWHASGHLCCALTSSSTQEDAFPTTVCCLTIHWPTSIKQLLLLASPSFSYCGC